MNARLRIVVLIALSLGLLLGVIAYVYLRAESNPNALWVIVQSCVDQNQSGHLVGPCVAVDKEHHVAIIRSIEGRAQFLLVPTARVTGIEDPYVLNSSAPNYWALAWAAGLRYLPPDVVKDRTRIGLAINSVYGRSQNQLHIHIACVKESATHIIDAKQDAIGTIWSAPTIAIGGHMYRAMRIRGLALDGTNPFQLAASIPNARQHMGAQTVVLIGAHWDKGAQPGFYLLEDYAHQADDAFDFGHGEALLDEDCSS